MINHHLKYLFLLISIFLLSANLIGQESKEDLEKKRKKLEAEIEYTNQLINQTRKSKQATVNELNLLSNRINQRNELVATLKKEIIYLNRQIEINEMVIDDLNEELVELKQEYAKIVYFAYKHQNAYSKLIYLFSAEDLNQAYQRFRYLDQVSAYMRNEAKNIREKESYKEKELKTFNKQKAKKKQLLDSENTQVSRLEVEKVQKDNVVASLTGKEKQLKDDLRAKEKETKKLEKKIADIIAREIKPKKKDASGKDYALTPAEKQLSASFTANKGKLPWPIERGMISETFGVHQHPILKNVKTKNNGVDIATSSEMEARSVFDGEVVSVAPITATNIAVIIKHGEYFSVYSNLDYVYVKQGDKITTKEALGRVHTSLKGITELHFEVWKGKIIQNPAYWILPR